MSPLDSAIAELISEISSYQPGTTQAPVVGSSGHYKLRALVIAHAYLLRVKTLGIESDAAACERLYREGTVHFHKAGVPAAEVVVKEVLTPEQAAAVSAAIQTGVL